MHLLRSAVMHHGCRCRLGKVVIAHLHMASITNRNRTRPYVWRTGVSSVAHNITSCPLPECGDILGRDPGENALARPCHTALSGRARASTGLRSSQRWIWWGAGVRFRPQQNKTSGHRHSARYHELQPPPAHHLGGRQAIRVALWPAGKPLPTANRRTAAEN
jgi:hypothetical protein